MTTLNVTLPEKIFNLEKTDYERPSIFLGQQPGLFDTINKIYPKLWSRYKTLKSLDWDENEFDYSTCNAEFKHCDPSVYDMMIKTLAYQWESDSLAARAITSILGPVCTSSEAWAGYSRIAENECLIDGFEVLTPTGWIDLSRVKPNTLVAQFDPLDKKISFVHPTDYIEKDYDGNLFEFVDKNKLFHQIVTPGHRMFIAKRGLVNGESNTDFEVQLAKDANFLSEDSFGIVLKAEENDLTFLPGDLIEKREIYYKGKVRCITVPSGFFVTRYKDSVSVTGNCLHAATYSEIVRNSFDDPSEILDEILKVEEAHSRMLAVSNVFAKAHDASHRYALDLVPNDQETYNDIFMFVVALLVLERVQFMCSFAITFAIAETGQFMPIAKAVQKIAQDEYEIHVQYGMDVLQYEMQTDRGRTAYEQCLPLIVKLLNEVVATEDTWLDYAFSEGRELTGTTKEKMISFNHFNGASVAKFFEVEYQVTFPIVEQLPLAYMRDWINISSVQSSPQEEENNQYKVGIVAKSDDGATEEFDLGF